MTITHHNVIKCREFIFKIDNVSPYVHVICVDILYVYAHNNCMFVLFYNVHMPFSAIYELVFAEGV